MPNGKSRTFNLSRLESGHPMTESIDDDLVLNDGDPTSASMLAALRKVIDEATT
jgi:hypothetical protein